MTGEPPNQTQQPAAPGINPGADPIAGPPSQIGLLVARRLTKIEVNDYRAFRGHFDLDLGHGSNLLVYGENGAGKSSLYRAITDFLESPEIFVTDSKTKSRRSLRPEDNRHRFSSDPASVCLTFTSTSSSGTASSVFEWSATKNDPTSSEMRAVDKAKGCLDYRALLKVHLLPTGKRDIDLFDLFLRPLLGHFKNPASTPSLTFAEEWKRIQEPFAPYQRKPSRLDDWITQFNAGFERVAKDTVAKASELLKEFDTDLAVEIDFTPASYYWRPKVLSPPKIVAKPVFRRLQHTDYFHFLNEARLSALAIALYLAGLHVSAPAETRLLILDDILIGLDMSNRVKVLDLIQNSFSSWQILIFTYSKSWFERLKERVTDTQWVAPWKSVVLWEDWVGGEGSPRIVAEDGGDPLETAQRHLLRKDYAAAAIYARTALEALCYRACAKGGLRVLHVEKSKERKLEHYIEAIEHRLGELRDEVRRAAAVKLIERLRESRAFVLNRESHFDVDDQDTLSGEVGEAIKTVTDLKTFLTPELWKKVHFQDGSGLAPVERLIVDLAEARKLATHRSYALALRTLASAHGAAWEAFGARHQVCLPIGAQLSPQAIWEAALAQGKLEAVFDEKLKLLRPYLFGSVEIDAFRPEQFDAATRLLEEISAELDQGGPAPHSS